MKIPYDELEYIENRKEKTDINKLVRKQIGEHPPVLPVSPFSGTRGHQGTKAKKMKNIRKFVKKQINGYSHY
jgi:hypothetical protein